jgi:hypothetical protein
LLFGQLSEALFTHIAVHHARRNKRKITTR